MRPQEILSAFDRFLGERGLRFEGVVVGGAALALLDLIKRETKDCDVLDPELPEEIRAAASSFAGDLVFTGAALRLSTLGRPDLLKAKIFALCDRGIDLADCIARAPTADELGDVAPWLEKQDGNPKWPEHVQATLEDLGKRLGHGV